MMPAHSEENARIGTITPALGVRAAVHRRRLLGFLTFVIAFGGFVLLRHVAEAQRHTIEAEWAKFQSLDSRLWGFVPRSATGLQAALAPGQSISPRRHFNNYRSEAEIPGLAFGEQYRGWTVVVQFTGQPMDPADSVYVKGWHIVGPSMIRESRTQFWWAVENVRRTIIGLSPIAWLAGIALALSVRGLGQRLWPLCVSAGLACTMAGVMSLGFGREQAMTPTWSPFHVGIGMTLLSALLPLIRRRRPAITGHCENCGYDLTGNQSGICPECGTPTPLCSRQQRLAAVSDIADRLDHVIAPAPVGEQADATQDISETESEMACES